MTTFNYTPSMTPDPTDPRAYDRSAPHDATTGGFEDPIVAELHRARLATFTSKPTLSSKGRRSFRVTSTRPRYDYGVIVEYPTDSIVPFRSVVRTSARDLIAAADDWMTDHADECDGCEACGWHDAACTDDGCADGCDHAPIRLMGRDGDARAYAQVIRTDRSMNTGDAPGEFAGWPTRYAIRTGKPRQGETPDPVVAYMAPPVRGPIRASTLTVTALPSAADVPGRVHVGCATYDRGATQAEQRTAARVARETAVYASQADATDVEALWSQLAPGERVTGTVRGHEMTLSRGMSGQTRVTYNGTSWKARTARSVAARIS